MVDRASATIPKGAASERLWRERLGGRAAMVTGASSGVGRAITVALLEAGVTVCLVGRRCSALEATVRLARSEGPASGLIFEADLASDRALEAMARSLERDLGRLDILIHSAGAIRRGPIETQTVADFDHQHEVNVRGPYRLTQLMLPWLKRQGGDIVFINSSLGLRSGAGAGQYAATKHALRAIADTVRDEVNGDGIRVLTVFLGQTATPMQEQLYELEGKPYRANRLIQAEDVASMVVHTLALPRTAEVTEIVIRPRVKPQ